MSKNIEQEFKWNALSRTSFDDFIRALEQVADKLTPVNNLYIIDYYMDDAAGTLATRKIALRIRRVGAHWEATLKSRSALKNGLAVRQEYTRSFRNVHTFTAAWLTLKKWKTWHEIDLSKMELYFMIQNSRRVYQVKYGTCQCEAALDDYLTLAGGHKMSRKEIELELKKGSQKSFKKLIEKVTQISGLKAAKLSKVAGAEKWILQNFRTD